MKDEWIPQLMPLSWIFSFLMVMMFMVMSFKYYWSSVLFMSIEMNSNMNSINWKW